MRDVRVGLRDARVGLCAKAPETARGTRHPSVAADPLRWGQVAHASDSPSEPVTSGPPQEPRRQRPSSITPIAMIAMTIAIAPNVSRNTAIVLILTRNETSIQAFPV